VLRKSSGVNYMRISAGKRRLLGDAISAATCLQNTQIQRTTIGIAAAIKRGKLTSAGARAAVAAGGTSETEWPRAWVRRNFAFFMTSGHILIHVERSRLYVLRNIVQSVEGRAFGEHTQERVLRRSCRAARLTSKMRCLERREPHA